MAKVGNSLDHDFFREVEVSLTSGLVVRSSSFHPIEPVLACGFSEEIVLLKGSSHSTPISTWKIERRLPCENSVLSLKWNTNGTKLAAGSLDGTAVIWNYPTGEKRLLVQIDDRSNHPVVVWNPLNCNVFASFYESADSKRVLICDASDDSCYSYDFKANQNVSCVEWISRNQLICGYVKGTAEIHEIELSAKSTSKLIKKLVVSARVSHSSDPYSLSEGGMGYKVSSIVWNEELKLLATSSKDSWIKIWSLEKEDPIRMIESSACCCQLIWSPTELPSSGIGSVERAMEKPFLVGGLENGSILVWSPTEKEIQPSLFFDGHSHELYQIAFSPNGRFLASTDYEGKSVIWSTKNWEMIYTLSPSGFHHRCTMSWDSASSKLSISEGSGQKELKMIEHVVAEGRCANCKKTSPNLKLCSRCLSISYCSKECQLSHWSNHKTVCHKK